MIDWKPISEHPKIVMRLDKPLMLVGKPLLAVSYSDPVACWVVLDGKEFWARDTIVVQDGNPNAAGMVYGRSITHWAYIDGPSTEAQV
jgi:hypothetical protein